MEQELYSNQNSNRDGTKSYWGWGERGNLSICLVTCMTNYFHFRGILVVSVHVTLCVSVYSGVLFVYLWC